MQVDRGKKWDSYEKRWLDKWKKSFKSFVKKRLMHLFISTKGGSEIVKANNNNSVIYIYIYIYIYIH
jgi:hypothetical protein